MLYLAHPRVRLFSVPTLLQSSLFPRPPSRCPTCQISTFPDDKRRGTARVMEELFTELCFLDTDSVDLSVKRDLLLCVSSIIGRVGENLGLRSVTMAFLSFIHNRIQLFKTSINSFLCFAFFKTTGKTKCHYRSWYLNLPDLPYFVVVN